MKNNLIKNKSINETHEIKNKLQLLRTTTTFKTFDIHFSIQT